MGTTPQWHSPLGCACLRAPSLLRPRKSSDSDVRVRARTVPQTRWARPQGLAAHAFHISPCDTLAGLASLIAGLRVTRGASLLFVASPGCKRRSHASPILTMCRRAAVGVDVAHGFAALRDHSTGYAASAAHGGAQALYKQLRNARVCVRALRLPAGRACAGSKGCGRAHAAATAAGASRARRTGRLRARVRAIT